MAAEDPLRPPPSAEAAPRRKIPLAWVRRAAIVGTAAVSATTHRPEHHDGFDADGPIPCSGELMI